MYVLIFYLLLGCPKAVFVSVFRDYLINPILFTAFFFNSSSDLKVIRSPILRLHL